MCRNCRASRLKYLSSTIVCHYNDRIRERAGNGKRDDSCSGIAFPDKWKIASDWSAAAE